MKKSLFRIFIPRKSFLGFSVFLASLLLLWTAPATALVVKWQKDLPTYTNGNIALGPDNSLYLSIQTGADYSVDILYRITPDGSTANTYTPLGGMVDDIAIGADGTIYIHAARNPSKLIALTPDLNEKWSVPFEDGFVSPAIGHDGTIYTASSHSELQNNEHRLIALNPSDGSQKWTCVFSNMPGALVSKPMIAPDGTIYMVFSEYYYHGGTSDVTKKIFAIRSNGIVKWEASFSNRVKLYMMGVASDGTLYILDWIDIPNWSQARRVKAIDPDDGSVKWDLQLNPVGHPHSNVAIGPDDTIYISANDHTSNSNLLLFVRPDGTIKKTIPLPAMAEGGPVMGADRTIYLFCADDYLRAIDSHTGSQKWEYYLPTIGRNYHPVISPDGTIYLGNSHLNHTKLYAIESNASPCLDCVWASYRGNNRRTGEGAKSALTPRLITPQNFQEISVQNAANAIFQWKPMGGNPSYRIEISDIPSFPVTISGNFNSNTVPINLVSSLPIENFEYFWRVKALTPDALYSPYRSFVYGDKTQMIRPIIKSPTYDAVLKSPVHLEWEHQGATNYRVLILTEPVWRPDTVVHDQILSDTHLDKVFTTYRTYYMAVHSNIANSEWSIPYKFKVISGN